MESFVERETVEAGKIVELIAREREKSLSDREWLHRIAGYGYSVCNTAAGPVITSLSQGTEICPLPATLHS